MTIQTLVKKFPWKDPAEAIPLLFDFTSDLPTGVTLNAVTRVTVTMAYGTDPSPSAILNGSQGLDATLMKAVVPVIGGLTGCGYIIQVDCATTQSDLSLTLIGMLPVYRQVWLGEDPICP